MYKKILLVMIVGLLIGCTKYPPTELPKNIINNTPINIQNAPQTINTTIPVNTTVINISKINLTKPVINTTVNETIVNNNTSSNNVTKVV